MVACGACFTSRFLLDPAPCRTERAFSCSFWPAEQEHHLLLAICQCVFPVGVASALGTSFWKRDRLGWVGSGGRCQREAPVFPFKAAVQEQTHSVRFILDVFVGAPSSPYITPAAIPPPPRSPHPGQGERKKPPEPEFSGLVEEPPPPAASPEIYIFPRQAARA